MTDVTPGLGSSPEVEPTGVDDATGAKPDKELEGLPLHLHPRGKELVAEKNRAKQTAAQYEGFGTPTELAQKLARADMLEDLVAADEKKPEPKTAEERTEAQKAEWARRELEKLLPELKEFNELKNKLGAAEAMIELQKSAIEDEAMETTEELAEELGMDSGALATMLIPVIKTDKKLLRQYNTGKSEAAVRGALKVLQAKFGGKSDIKERADALKQADLASHKLPKTHTPGGKPEATAELKKPTTWKEADARANARLEKAGR